MIHKKEEDIWDVCSVILMMEFKLTKEWNSAFLAAQWSRTHLPKQEMQFQPLGWEEPLEKEMTTYSSILAWEIPGIEKPGGLQSMVIRIRHDLMTKSEKAVTPHSSTLAWKTPWMEEPGGLQTMGSLRVGNEWATSLSLFTFTHWRRKLQSTPVFLPGESQGRWSLVGCRLWGHTESDTTEAT